MEQASPKSTGARIKARREQLKMSRAELARKVAVTRETMAAWESGQSDPRANKLWMLAGVLGTNVSWLLGGDEGCAPAPTPTNDIAAVRQQLGQARDLAQNLSYMLDSLQRRIDELEAEQSRG